SLPLALQPVGIFRDPQAVADSLHRRDAIPPDLALKLWETYNQRLLDAWQAAPFPLIDFDLPDDELKRSIGRVADWLGLPNRDKAGFFDAALRHHNPQPNPLKRQDSPVYQLHRQLQEAAVS